MADSGDGDDERYIRAAQENLATMRRLVESSDWKHMDVKDGVKISSRNVPGSSVICMRGDGIINAPPEVVFLAASSLEDRPKWDTMFERGVLLRNLTPTIRLSHLFFKGRFPSAPRDFVLVSCRARDADGTLLIGASSVDVPSEPPTRGYVRAISKTSGYVIRAKRQPDGRTITDMTYVVQMDPGGWVPAPIANAVALHQPLCIAAIRKLVEAKKSYHQLHPELPTPALPPLPATDAAVPPMASPAAAVAAAATSAADSATVGMSATTTVAGPPGATPAPSEIAASVQTQPAHTQLQPVEQAPAAVPPPLQPVPAAQPESAMAGGSVPSRLPTTPAVSALALDRVTHALQDVQASLDQLLLAHRAHHDVLQRMCGATLLVVESERRLEMAAADWSQRFRALEASPWDPLRALLLGGGWRRWAALAALVLLWPVLANVLFRVLQLRWRRTSRRY